NALALAPNVRYLISVRTRGGAFENSCVTVHVLQYSAEALLAKARATARRGSARLALRTKPELRGASVVLVVSGSGSIAVDAIKVYPLDAPPREIERWVDAAATDDDALDLASLIRARRPRRSEDERYHFQQIA